MTDDTTKQGLMAFFDDAFVFPARLTCDFPFFPLDSAPCPVFSLCLLKFWCHIVGRVASVVQFGEKVSTEARLQIELKRC